MSETTLVTVSTLEERNEVQVPTQFIEAGNIDRIVSFLRESEIAAPNEPMLTKSETGYIIHETPVFG